MKLLVSSWILLLCL